MPEHHTLMDGRLHVYRREGSGNWQCSVFMGGKNWRASTKHDSLALAKDFALDWYFTLRGKKQAGVLKTGKTFREAAKRFLEEFEILTSGERNAKYIERLSDTIRVHLNPFFGDKVLSEVTPGLVLEYRIHRMTSRKNEKTGIPIRPARSTLHQEIVALRHVLKTANRHGWLPYLPDLSAPYKTSGKISHRGWFSPEEYKRLYEATRERAKNPINPRWRKECEQLHDYILFMTNTGLRPDEASRLEFRDVAIVTDEATGERILEIEVRGKRGVGYCKSMPGAVTPFQRVKNRVNGQPTNRVFGKVQRELINTILAEVDLKFDRDGNRRTAYSLRHTYICFRLMEGADIYQVAKNCRTSVEMIEKFYASHIKNMIDAAAINVRKDRSKTRRPRKAPPQRPRPGGRRKRRKIPVD